MTTVYLTVTAVDYEGDTTLAVSSSREKALLEFQPRCADPDDPTRMGCHHDRHWIEGWEVDGKAVAEEVFSDAIEDAWSRARVGEGGGGRR